MTNKRLIELYKLVLSELRRECLYGICHVIDTLFSNDRITQEEYKILERHFYQTTYLTNEKLYNGWYYFPRGEKAPRIKLLTKIIVNLEALEHTNPTNQSQ